ncbi:hypothetical protein M153_3200004470 [Pseudoloma neurophilia]|uniref:Uncharacterized protein n=1 Tax=Pseudoloma neurophilia TaxID=146866 RepID=A0A0R0LY91_9MICR|nr:hypothetical protein M153_3200004470 [Pseudoloma neurophilia]
MNLYVEKFNVEQLSFAVFVKILETVYLKNTIPENIKSCLFIKFRVPQTNEFYLNEQLESESQIQFIGFHDLHINRLTSQNNIVRDYNIRDEEMIQNNDQDNQYDPDCEITVLEATVNGVREGHLPMVMQQENDEILTYQYSNSDEVNKYNREIAFQERKDTQTTKELSNCGFERTQKQLNEQYVVDNPTNDVTESFADVVSDLNQHVESDDRIVESEKQFRRIL